MATRTMRPRNQTEERPHRGSKEETLQPPDSYPQTRTTKGNRATFRREQSRQIPTVKKIFSR